MQRVMNFTDLAMLPGGLPGGRPSVRGKPELPRGSTAGLPGKTGKYDFHHIIHIRNMLSS